MVPAALWSLVLNPSVYISQQRLYVKLRWQTFPKSQWPNRKVYFPFHHISRAGALDLIITPDRSLSEAPFQHVLLWPPWMGRKAMWGLTHRLVKPHLEAKHGSSAHADLTRVSITWEEGKIGRLPCAKGGNQRCPMNCLLTITMHLREGPGTKPQRTIYEIQGASRERADKVPRYLLNIQ